MYSDNVLIFYMNLLCLPTYTTSGQSTSLYNKIIHLPLTFNLISYKLIYSVIILLLLLYLFSTQIKFIKAT